MKALELRIPRRLESPNVWNGRHWRTKHRISQEWGDFITYAARSPYAWPWGREPVKLSLTVERHVPSARNFIKDDDNLRFAVKPLLDALKRLGFIADDSRKWLEHPTPTQHISEDGKDWTVVRIQPVDDAIRAVAYEGNVR